MLIFCCVGLDRNNFIFNAKCADCVTHMKGTYFSHLFAAAEEDNWNFIQY